MFESVDASMDASMDWAYHGFPEEHEALQRPHGLRARVDVAKHNVRLAAHLHGPERDDVEDDAVGCE